MATRGDCLVCGTTTTKSCSSCKSAFYCSQEHQKQNWKSHKEYCTQIASAGTKTFDAILFATNETKPRRIKLPWTLTYLGPDKEDPFHKLHHGIWFKEPHSAPKHMYINRWGMYGPELGRMLCLIFDDNFSVNKAPLNRCAQSVTGGKAGHAWCGNMLGVRVAEGYDFFESVDVEEDLGPLVKYLEEYGRF